MGLITGIDKVQAIAVLLKICFAFTGVKSSFKTS